MGVYTNCMLQQYRIHLKSTDDKVSQNEEMHTVIIINEDIAVCRCAADLYLLRFLIN